MRKCAAVFSILVLLIISEGRVQGGADPSTLAVPYHSYTYDYWQEPVSAPQAYIPVQTLRGEDLGIGPFAAPRDLFIDSAGRIYISDGGNNRIIQLDSDLQVDKVITGFINEGARDSFSAPRGIYVTAAGLIYIADRNNSRIVVLDQQGELVQIVGPPQPKFTGVLRDDFRYNPNRIGVDNVGRIFVVSDEVYDGILEFDPQGEFRGFIGAPKITPNLVDYLWRRFSSAERKKLLALFLPTEHSSIDIDDQGFIFTTVTDGEIRYSEAIRRLNPAGTDVLRRAGAYAPVGDYGSALLDQYGESSLASSLLVDIIARKNGMYSALDQRRGRIFTYDENGLLLYVFGGMGLNLGTFQIPEALAERGDDLYVLDRGTNMITIFQPTEYAAAIHAAIAYYHDDDWSNSVAQWDRVKQMNVNLDVAHTGIGRAQLREDEFAQALHSFRLGEDRVNYSKAFGLYRRQVIYNNFTAIVIFLLVGAGALGAAVRFKLVGKVRLALLKWEAKSGPGFALLKSLAYAFYVITHPLDGFWDLKHEKRGNMVSAGIILGLLTLSYVYARQYTGFVFNSRDLKKLNIYVEFASILVPFLLWTVVNWSLTTISDGKGSFKDIFITVAYACTPLIITNIPLTFISNYLTVEEGSFYYTLTSLGVVWTAVLIFLGTMVVHEYDFGKTTAFAGLTVVGIGLTLFIGLLYFNLAEQVYQFFSEVYVEIVFRN